MTAKSSADPAELAPSDGKSSGPAPSVGRIVHYRLSKGDVAEINRRRKRFTEAPSQSWGFQAHTGNQVHAGDVFPAVVVRIFEGNDVGTCNLSVLLDGSDTYWATSRKPGDEDGQWFWPPRT